MSRALRDRLKVIQGEIVNSTVDPRGRKTSALLKSYIAEAIGLITDHLEQQEGKINILQDDVSRLESR